MTKIGLVDDHFAYRFGISHLLKQNQREKYSVTLEASNGKDLIDQLDVISKSNNKMLPEIILLDIFMPVKDGKETADYLSVAFPNLKIIFLSVFLDKEMINNYLKKGVLGFVSKNAEPIEILNAITIVQNNNIYIDKQFNRTELN
jgi:DNA-binding NarL/FixJ family response regulator